MCVRVGQQWFLKVLPFERNIWVAVLFLAFSFSFQAKKWIFLESWRCAYSHVSVLVEFVLEHLSTLFTGGLSWLHVNLNVIPQVTLLAACGLSTHLARPHTFHFLFEIVWTQYTVCFILKWVYKWIGNMDPIFNNEEQ